MNISIPTDSLNKFLAIGSLAAMVMLLNICIDNYYKAELSLIDVMVKTEEINNICIELCPKVDYFKERMETIRNRKEQLKVNRYKTEAELDALSIEIKEIQKEIKELKPLVDKGDSARIQMNALIRKSNLLYFIRNIWLTIGSIVTIICLIVGFLGFKGWYLESKTK